GNFATFMRAAQAAFNRMNNFWSEGTYGQVSFMNQYVTTDVLDLPKSKDFYYHRFRQREITSRGLPATITFPADQTLTIGSGFDGQNVQDVQDTSVTHAVGRFIL